MGLVDMQPHGAATSASQTNVLDSNSTYTSGYQVTAALPPLAQPEPSSAAERLAQ